MFDGNEIILTFKIYFIDLNITHNQFCVLTYTIHTDRLEFIWGMIVLVIQETLHIIMTIVDYRDRP